MFLHNFFPLILRPTRVGISTASLIDHIWCNKPCHVIDSCIVLSNITDHYAVSCILSCNSASLNHVKNNYVPVSRRANSSRNKAALTDALLSVDWNNIFQETNVEVKRLDIEKPYINDVIKTALKKKHKLQKLFNKRPVTYGAEYREARNRVNSLIRTAKAGYYRDKLQQSSSDAKGTWKVINTLLGRIR